MEMRIAKSRYKHILPRWIKANYLLFGIIAIVILFNATEGQSEITLILISLAFVLSVAQMLIDGKGYLLEVNVEKSTVIVRYVVLVKEKTAKFELVDTNCRVQIMSKLSPKCFIEISDSSRNSVRFYNNYDWTYEDFLKIQEWISLKK